MVRSAERRLMGRNAHGPERPERPERRNGGTLRAVVRSAGPIRNCDELKVPSRRA